jgi:AraC-like DNA-binding protein
VADPQVLIDVFVRGAASGALVVMGVSFLTSGLARHVRMASSVACASIVAWLICEDAPLHGAIGGSYLLQAASLAVAGMFWLMVRALFEDRPLRAWHWLPPAILFASTPLDAFMPAHFGTPLWAARNALSGVFCLHAAYLIARGWSGDLLELRRRMRAFVLGFAALLAVTNVVIGFVLPREPWIGLMINHPLGGAIFSAVILASATVLLQARGALLAPARRTSSPVDSRAEAADRLVLQQLAGRMAAGEWRREGLSIGALAGEMAVPEHRLRRLINQRLGHRNFAEFVNSHRIEAAKLRLADPAEARTTVAAIAFDLGFGSLGPFNRAFRAATGLTPTEWRREALVQASPELQEAV